LRNEENPSAEIAGGWVFWFALPWFGLVWFGLVWFGLAWATDLKGHYNPWVLGGSSAVCFHCHEKRGETHKNRG